MNGARVRRLVVAALLLALNGGCDTLTGPRAPRVTGEWASLLNEIRAFERRIGFVDTGNFAALSQEEDEYPFCGRVSRFTLPYSYEDPAIKWLEAKSEEACRAHSVDVDVYWGASEALGEMRTPVTRSMVDGKLDRFVYVVIHENCHDQFALPFGVEEALCELITYQAMAMFGAEKYGSIAHGGKAIRSYAETQSARTRATVAHYDRLALTYARFERKEISPELLLRERAAIFTAAQQQLGWHAREMNNVAIANRMTYSRYYPLMESVFDALGRDLARMVALFRQVDSSKPSGVAVMELKRIADEHSLDFIRAYELAVVETIRTALAGAGTVEHRSR